ncbi:MAG: hypoxanthine phosphoribosyltransferase [Eubacteriales bacterium]|nr:hypoxanthine phosphoribosyltransferase [Eubacteriales bacterium]
MDLNYKRVAFTEEILKNRISELGAEISRDYAGKDLVLVSVLKGTLYFFADLTRAIDLPIRLDFISIGVYPNATNRTGAVRITKDLDIDISGKHVLVIEDIIRTGLTTGYLVQNLESRMPSSVKVCSLLVNPEQQLINVPIAYYGFRVPNAWLIGYGMDVNEKWRNVPYIVEVDKADL